MSRMQYPLAAVILLVSGGLPGTVPLAAVESPSGETITLNQRDVPIAEVMDMLSRRSRVNILLSNQVTGSVSFNLYDVSLDEAIRSIASAAGYAVELRGDSYFITTRDEAKQYSNGGVTSARAFEVQYADPVVVVNMLTPYLSGYGKIGSLPERKIVIVEDTPPFLDRIAAILDEIDRHPNQILIEARILEVSLDDEESYGINWQDLFNSRDGDGSFGTRGLANAGSSGSRGFFFEVVNSDFTAMLNLLSEQGRVRTLSTPQLLALENQEASVIIGDRQGFRVTTTINQVTTESIEFLESGVILRVIPWVDTEGRIMMDIHPEVSNGIITDGIPSQTTTEVTTRLLVPSGRTVFIGGLMKHTLSERNQGVPGLKRIPLLGKLFSNNVKVGTNTETIVLITPHIVADSGSLVEPAKIEKVREAERLLGGEAAQTEQQLEELTSSTTGKTDFSSSVAIAPPTR
ncbi:MAG TPA: secretin N-terminal domain-containing protein [Gammaproteobacteria bacterium]|nr:secretin N-terminal domain-containing protein [Gammaproteobacteria bacterium]